MFDNSEDKLELYLEIFFGLMVAVDVLLGLFVFKGNWILRLILVVVGAMINYLVTLMGMAFVQLLRNTRRCSERLAAIEEKLNSTATEQHSAGSAYVDSETNYLGARPLKGYVGAKPATQEWKCPVCGKTNPSYCGTCGCGCEKP